MEKKTQAFQAEVSEMLDLVVHSLYSKKEIFLRELISNASDAIDKAQYLGLTDKSVVADSPEWAISIVADRDAKTLTITDNGIGMTAEEAENNLGTIARSGTQAFMESLKKGEGTNAPEMIGQFGVGFYAAFMVADKVTVDTLRRGEGQEAVRWISDGKGEYSIEPSDRKEPGTSIILHIADEHSSYLQKWEIASLVKQYSDFIAYPIRFRELPVAADEKDEDRKRREEDEQKPLNTMRAIWRRAKNEIKEEEYKEFYKHITHDYDDPLRTIHIVAEGQVEYRALLFLPAKPGYDLFLPDRKHGLQLYVRNVFIGSDFEALLPEYLRFVKGVVDSSDLPLNVSREMLQEARALTLIRKNITKKVLDTLAGLQASAPERYLAFYNSFGAILKEGLREDFENREKIEALLLFNSSTLDDDKKTTLAEYVKRMPEAQKEIFYLPAEKLEAAKNSPQLEVFKRKGFEVLFMTDPVDEFVIPSVESYQEKRLRDISKGDVDLETEEEKKAHEEERKNAESANAALVAKLKELLKDQVEDVRLANRLTDSACCLVDAEWSMSPQMIRIMKAMKQEVPDTKQILEINPAHPLVASLRDLCGKDAADARLATCAKMLFDTARLTSNQSIDDPLAFAKQVTELMAKDLQ
jgi:molecular chaperone HtpG